MRGYKTVQEYDLADCVKTLQEDGNNLAVREHLGKLEQQIFESCSSKMDYEQYISSFEQISSIYKAKMLEKAKLKVVIIKEKEHDIEVERETQKMVFERCKQQGDIKAYLNQYPSGIYADEARKLILEENKFGRGCLMILGLILLVSFLIPAVLGYVF